MKVILLKNCDTCRKAVKALEAAQKQFEPVDIRQDGIKADDLSYIVKTLGYEKALNRRSTTWRSLDAAQKSDLDNEKAIALISEHPTLLKRPAIFDEHHISVGWDDKAKSLWL